VMAYDLAISSCEKGDFDKAIKAVSVLRDALNFDYAEVAVGLFQIYQWCLNNIRQGDFKSALQTLCELREAWAEVEKRYLPIPLSPAYASVPGMGQSL
jgi:flagellar protein FliS